MDRKDGCMADKNDAFYIQQHLANERTFLAWIRTALAMKGIGFLVFGVELVINSGNGAGGPVAIGVSMISYAAGMGVLISGTVLYFKNRRSINDQKFQSASGTILTAGILVTIVLSALLFYAVFVYY
jgi:putative membrane protein